MKKKKIGFVESMMHHHRIIYLIIVLLIGYGIYGLIGMNKQEFPEFTLREGIVAALSERAVPLHPAYVGGNHTPNFRNIAAIQCGCCKHRCLPFGLVMVGEQLQGIGQLSAGQFSTMPVLPVRLVHDNSVGHFHYAPLYALKFIAGTLS